MFISRIVLNGRSPDARAWLGDCHRLHREIMSGFPALDGTAARAQFGVLFRIEPTTTPPYVPVLVQSAIEPRWQFASDAVVQVEGPKPLSTLLNGIMAGKHYRFRLRANPTRRVHARATLEADEARGRKRPERSEAKGKRVELTREADQIAWLQRQAERSGFRLVSVRRLPEWPDTRPDIPAVLAVRTGKSTGWRRPAGYGRSRGPDAGLRSDTQDGARLTFATVLFEGMLEVTDVGAFRSALAKGIGPGKAFGCGLLSVAPML
jgi:CRISPR system Cascade subunit CasE